MSKALIRKWLNDNWKHLKKYPEQIENYEGDDILQEVIVQFLEMEPEKTTKLITSGEAEKYIMSMYKVNCFSKTSPYQYKYNKVDKVELLDKMYHYYEPSYQVCWTDLEYIINDLDIFFLDKVVYKDYIRKKLKQKGYSINKMSKESTIPLGTLDLMFKKIRIELKNDLKKIIEIDDEERND
jgi:hypothetical protein